MSARPASAVEHPPLRALMMRRRWCRGRTTAVEGSEAAETLPAAPWREEARGRIRTHTFTEPTSSATTREEAEAASGAAEAGCSEAGSSPASGSSSPTSSSARQVSRRAQRRSNSRRHVPPEMGAPAAVSETYRRASSPRRTQSDRHQSTSASLRRSRMARHVHAARPESRTSACLMISYATSKLIRRSASAEGAGWARGEGSGGGGRGRGSTNGTRGRPGGTTKNGTRGETKGRHARVGVSPHLRVAAGLRRRGVTHGQPRARSGVPRRARGNVRTGRETRRRGTSKISTRGL